MRKRLGPLHLEANAWAINRPWLTASLTDRRWNVALSWGNGNSDPVWLIDLTVPLPDRVEYLLWQAIDWRQRRRAR